MIPVLFEREIAIFHFGIFRTPDCQYKSKRISACGENCCMFTEGENTLPYFDCDDKFNAASILHLHDSCSPENLLVNKTKSNSISGIERACKQLQVYPFSNVFDEQQLFEVNRILNTTLLVCGKNAGEEKTSTLWYEQVKTNRPLSVCQ